MAEIRKGKKKIQTIDITNLNEFIYDALRERLKDYPPPLSEEEIKKLNKRELQAYYLNEYNKCKESYLYFSTYYVKVNVPGTDEYNTFKLMEAQLAFVDAMDKIQYGDYIGAVYLASRQCGKTTTLYTYSAWAMLFNDNYSVAMMCSTFDVLGRQTLDNIKQLYENLPSFLRPQIVAPTNATQVVTISNGSYFRVLPSGGVGKSGNAVSAKGRGIRVLLLWIDEAAIFNLGAHLTAMLPSVSRTFVTAKEKQLPHGVILTSSPNGRTGIGETFFRYYTEASLDPDTFKFSAITVHWSDLKGIYDEEWFKQQTASMTPRQIAQEYNNAFLGSETTFVADETIANLIDKSKATEPIKIEKFRNGYVHWFKEPKFEKKYIVGIDTATSYGSDASAVQVIDFDTEEQICEGKFKCEVNQFTNEYIPKIVNKLINKVLIIETNGVGNQTRENLRLIYPNQILKPTKANSLEEIREYDKYGLHLSVGERKSLFDEIFNLLTYKSHLIKSYECRFEASTLEEKGGRIEGAVHDDLIIALGYCHYAKHTYSNLRYYLLDPIEIDEVNEKSDEYLEISLEDEDDIDNLSDIEKLQKEQAEGLLYLQKKYSKPISKNERYAKIQALQILNKNVIHKTKEEEEGLMKFLGINVSDDELLLDEL